VPTGYALFPEKLLSWTQRRYVERAFKVTHRTEMFRGDRLVAMEQPELLAKDIRTFAHTLRRIQPVVASGAAPDPSSPA